MEPAKKDVQPSSMPEFFMYDIDEKENPQLLPSLPDDYEWDNDDWDDDDDDDD